MGWSGKINTWAWKVNKQVSLKINNKRKRRIFRGVEE